MRAQMRGEINWKEKKNDFHSIRNVIMKIHFSWIEIARAANCTQSHINAINGHAFCFFIFKNYLNFLWVFFWNGDDTVRVHRPLGFGVTLKKAPYFFAPK